MKYTKMGKESQICLWGRKGCEVVTRRLGALVREVRECLGSQRCIWHGSHTQATPLLHQKKIGSMFAAYLALLFFYRLFHETRAKKV